MVPDTWRVNVLMLNLRAKTVEFSSKPFESFIFVRMEKLSIAST